MDNKKTPQQRYYEKKLIKEKKVFFHIENERTLLKYAEKQPVFSAYIKSLIEKDIEKNF